MTDEDLEQTVERDRLAADRELARLRAELANLRGRYKSALAALDAEHEKTRSLAALGDIQAAGLPARRSPRRSAHRATAVVVLSDWHVEENVTLGQTAGANEYSLDVADRRISELAERIGTLIEHERRLVRIDRIVVAVLGDLISGHIHEELVETCEIPPLEATRWAGSRLRSLIDLASDLAREVIVVTQPGNHGRSNAGRPRAATEHDHSFEQNLYVMMAAGELRKNVRWDISEGYLGYLDLDGFVLRYHHGHAIRYGGGIGGISIPVNKAIAQWNRGRRADLDVFGHWHQWQHVRGRYVSNGSLIGINSFGIRIKAEPEAPCQSLLVIDHGRRECTRALQLYCDRDLRARK